jgi:hypothetical protein
MLIPTSLISVLIVMVKRRLIKSPANVAKVQAG